MTPEEQRIAIAEACGWTELLWRSGRVNQEDRLHGYKKGKERQRVPDYHNDLNAIHEAESTLPDDNSMHGLVVFCNILAKICGTHRACVHATAAQRSEAFLRTIGKWAAPAASERISAGKVR